MKNKEQIIGWVLIAALMIGFIFYQSKQFTKEQKKKAELAQAAREDSLKAVKNNPKPVIAGVDSTTGSAAGTAAATDETQTPDSSGLAAQYGAFANAGKGEEQTFVIENDLQKITLTSKGGQIKSVELKKYKTWDKKPLILFTDKTNSLSYQLRIDGNQSIDTRDLYFTAVGQGFTVTGDSSKTFALRLSAGEGKYFEQTYTLKGNSYLLNYGVNTVGLNSVLPATNTFIEGEWNATLQNLEQNTDRERTYSALYYRYKKDNVEHLSEDKETDEVADAPGQLEWISFKQQFFNTTLFTESGFNHTSLKSNFAKTDHSYLKKYRTHFTMPFNPNGDNNYKMQLYMGPNSFKGLAALDKDVEKIVKLGPDNVVFGWIGYITRFIIWVFSWFNSVHLNYGIIILLMTIILKIALHPLTAKSIESAAKMKILAPEIAALKEKYGDDQAKIGAEQMKLYQRAGVSPFGGCLPLLLQMPILMAMYYFFPTSIELRQQPFLWATDLSSYDAIVTFAQAVPIIGITHISLFTILMTITSIGQAVMNNQMNAGMNQQPGMKYMPYFMPILLMVMFNGFPAALTYYYLLQNLLGMGHQWIIQKFFIDDAKLRKQIEDNKKNPKQASGWQKKLADMQKQAQEQQRQRKK